MLGETQLTELKLKTGWRMILMPLIPHNIIANFAGNVWSGIFRIRHKSRTQSCDPFQAEQVCRNRYRCDRQKRCKQKAMKASGIK